MIADAAVKLLLGTVATSRLLSAFYPKGVTRATDHLVANTRQVTDTTTSNKHDRVFLKIVTFAGNVNRHFLAVA